MNEQHFWTVFFATVAIWAAITTDCLSGEMDDPANAQAWHAAIDAHRERIKAVPVHTAEHPYCDDPACWCHLCEQEIPITLAEMEDILSEQAGNKDADELESSKRDWLSEHL